VSKVVIFSPIWHRNHILGPLTHHISSEKSLSHACCEIILLKLEITREGGKIQAKWDFWDNVFIYEELAKKHFWYRSPNTYPKIWNLPIWENRGWFDPVTLIPKLEILLGSTKIPAQGSWIFILWEISCLEHRNLYLFPP
jgi:hypothetical protein